MIQFATRDAEDLNDLIKKIGAEKIFTNIKSLTSDAGLLKKYAGWCALKKFYLKNTVAKYDYTKKTTGFILKTIEEEYTIKK